MARKPKDKEAEDLIDVGDEDESAVDITLEDDVNPNISDQLQTTAEAPETDDFDSDDEEEKVELSPEEILEAFLKDHPEVRELRSKDIKGRIDRLTYQQKEAERREQAAIEYARNVQKENAELKSKQQHQDGVFINEHKARLEAQLATAKEQYKDAQEAGDPELLAEANVLLARTSAELAQAEQTETRFQRFIRSSKPPEETLVPYAPEPSPNQRPPVDAKAEAWAKRNEWFGEDEEMTQAALSIHNQLVTQEGYIPTGNGYYAELDSRLRRNFPDKFEKPATSTAAPQGQQVVTPPSSTSNMRNPRGKRNIRLTPSQVSIAKKLGVPLEEYAKYVV